MSENCKDPYAFRIPTCSDPHSFKPISNFSRRRWQRPRQPTKTGRTVRRLKNHLPSHPCKVRFAEGYLVSSSSEAISYSPCAFDDEASQKTAPTTGGTYLSNSRTAAVISDTSSWPARATRIAPAGSWMIAAVSADDKSGGAARSTIS